VGNEIVKIYDLFSRNRVIYIVMEYCENGSLKDIMDSVVKKGKEYIEEEVINCLRLYKVILFY
jgi:serine/threonine protein kinase